MTVRETFGDFISYKRQSKWWKYSVFHQLSKWLQATDRRSALETNEKERSILLSVSKSVCEEFSFTTVVFRLSLAARNRCQNHSRNKNCVLQKVNVLNLRELICYVTNPTARVIG